MVITSLSIVLDGIGPFVERYQMPFMFLMSLLALTTMTMQLLKLDGLRGKRLGMVRNPFFDFGNINTCLNQTFAQHFDSLR